MTTIRRIERAWTSKQHERLFRELAAARPEATFPIDFEGGWAIPAAALAIIRMEELNQAHVPLCNQLIRVLLAAQEADGGWGDVAATALCIRALLCGGG